MQKIVNQQQLKELNIEVAYAGSNNLDQQTIVSLKVAAGTTIEQAIKRSGVLAVFPEINLSINPVGIFGQLKNLTTVVYDLARIEIYRDLYSDPNQIRQKKSIIS